MRIKLMRPIKVTVDAVRVVVDVEPNDLEESCCPADMPGLSGGVLILVLDLDRRAVRDWPAGRTASVYLKPRDSGSYYLLSGGEVVVTREGDYVPGYLPGEHYGDYLILDIGPDGTIAGWDPSAEDVAECIEASE